MSWFRKLSKERRANPNKQCNCQPPRICTHIEPVAAATVVVGPHMLSSLCCGQIELVDSEDFFQDPEHVRRYKEEEQFLALMSEWEIIDHPERHTNFFSADFEEELIHMKTQHQHPLMAVGVAVVDESDEQKAKELEMSQDQLIKTVACEQQRHRRRKFSEMLFGERIETGIAIPRVHSDFKVPLIKKKTELLTAGSDIDRGLQKTDALSQSIMGAIGRCPDVEHGSETRDGQSPHDHFDVKQFFRLDDNGNILLSINHIDEVKGCEIRHGRMFCRNYVSAQCCDESYARRKKWLVILKRILQALWNIFAGHPRNKINPIGGPGDSVRCYTLQLAGDHTSTFAQNIENFISCTKESREAAPQVVMRNMRQFMNGMKNYLVKHGEGKFHQEVESARARLKSDEFLNLDAILETVMHQLVVLPLREHLYGMFVDYYTRSEDIQLLAQNVKYACGRNATDFGIRSAVAPPTSSALHQISNLLLRLQEAELPLEKLDLFLCIISSIFDATGCPRGQQLGADDFLPILVFVVAKCGFVGAEIEAEFMWGLLQPALLNGEAGYYLTALCSAVHVLKSFMASDNEGTGSLDWRSSSLPACSSVLRVIIPDECNGSLQTRTLPVRPHTTTREVCRIIAHKARITNPQDYALFKLVDGEETLLTDVECPQDIRLAAKGKHCMLAYKRIDAKIAWPTAAQPSYT